jgi:cytochrome d ubiquinol oxidase subunit I
VYGVLRTADAATPFLTTRAVAISLVLYVVLYSFIFLFGVFYIYRLLQAGPAGALVAASHDATPSRPMSVAKTPLVNGQAQEARGD